MKKSRLVVCLLNFFIASVMGVVLRLSPLYPLDFNYHFLLHGHSHTALLGWIYLMLYTLIVHHFIPEEKQQNRYYTCLFWITQIAVTGMMISFPFQGYGLYSITFSTLHIFCSYFFCYKIWKEQRPVSLYDGILLKTALVFLLLSTIGVWSLGIIGASGTKNASLYQAAIQFFLHFQFNGWFIFGLLALLANRYHNYIKRITAQKFNHWVVLLIISTVLTYVLPLHWYFPTVFPIWINGIGVVLQLITFIAALLYFFKRYGFVIPKTSTTNRLLLYAGSIAITFKIIVQIATLFPETAMASHYIRNFTIGFIHLIMLGVVNTFLFMLTATVKPLHFLDTPVSRFGLLLFLSGFVITEFILFLQGGYFYFEKGYITNYYVLLFVFSLLLALGLFLILLGTLLSKKELR